MSQAPKLHVDEIVRLTPDGPWYRVVRVTLTGATLKPRNSQPKAVTIPGRPTFWALEGGKTITVSAHAFVYREGHP